MLKPLTCGAVRVALAGVCLLYTTLACAQESGKLNELFGDRGFVRVPINVDQSTLYTSFFSLMPSAYPFVAKRDSARSIQLRTEQISVNGATRNEQFLYVAGLAADRVAIAKLNMKGELVRSFGNNGIAISTGEGITSFAGLQLMPNGDLAIGYAGVLSGDRQYFDVHLEVFEANGRPKVLDVIALPGVSVPITRRSHSFICKDSWELIEDTDDIDESFMVDVRAVSLVKDASDNLLLSGNFTRFDDVDCGFTLGLCFNFASTIQWASTVHFSGPAQNYQVDQRSGMACHDYDEDRDIFVPKPSGGHALLMRPVGYENYQELGVRASTLVRDQLWLAGQSRYGNFGAAARAGSDNFCGVSLRPDQQNICGFNGLYSDVGVPFELATPYAIFGNSYWDARDSTIQSLASEEDRLYLYGHAAIASYPSGDLIVPIIAERLSEDSLRQDPHWLLLNPNLQSSAHTAKGLRVDGKHLLVGSLRDCVEGDCAQPYNRFFVAMSGESPDNGLYYGADMNFAEQGSIAHSVPVVADQPARAAQAFDAIVAEKGNGNDARSLFVVGEYETRDGDFDWFISKVYLGGAPGDLQVSVVGSGQATSVPVGINCANTGGSCVARFAGNAEVVLTATPTGQGQFFRWEGCTNTAGTECRVRMDGDARVRAQFR